MFGKGKDTAICLNGTHSFLTAVVVIHLLARTFAFVCSFYEFSSVT